MTSLGIILTLLSACCHATWNLLGKATGRPVHFSRLALFWSMAAYFPLFVYFSFHVPYTTGYTLCILGSGVLVGVYFYALSLAYETGDVSVVYPLARSFPLIVLAAAVAFTDHPLNGQAACGVALIVAGGFLLPMTRLKRGDGGLHLKAYVNRAAFMAILAAIFTAAYSLVDKYAAAETMPAGGTAVAIMARINYVYCQNALALVAVEVVFRLRKVRPLKVPVRKTLPAGLLFLVSYSLIIAAMADNPVAYVVSLRQVSIVIGSLVSMALLERRFYLPRVIGVAVIFAGVLLVGLAR